MQDICRYMRGDVRGAAACSLLQGIMETALERIEMRDEVICQLVRQTTDNSNTRSLERAWHIMCLACASFSPSRTLCRVSAPTVACYCTWSIIACFSQGSQIREPSTRTDLRLQLPECVNTRSMSTNLLYIHRIYSLGSLLCFTG